MKKGISLLQKQKGMFTDKINQNNNVLRILQLKVKIFTFWNVKKLIFLGRENELLGSQEIPFTEGFLVSCNSEKFHDLMKTTTLTHKQITICKDIRRRGKNKVWIMPSMVYTGITINLWNKKTTLKQYSKCIWCCYKANSFTISLNIDYELKWSVHTTQLLCLMYIGLFKVITK